MQDEIIASILNNNDVLALLPTGGGKSICYQVPAIIKDGFCLVVSPLIALMQDQVARLKEQHVNAACIHAGMHYNDVKRTLENAMHGGYKLLYVSPERLQTNLFLEYLPTFDISFIAVDEAHCISQWGHDFRPDYLKIAELRNVFKDIPMLALTASATEAVQRDIITQLVLKQPAFFKQSFERSNIFYEVRYTENKNHDLLQAISESTGSNIIYCRSRRQTELVSQHLNNNNIPALYYHAGMDKNKRSTVQDAWMGNEVNTIVATTAFGMGIDKANVRLVVHYDAPEHLEAYYQEAGRAGRDGKPALAATLYNHTDVKRLEDSIESQYPDEAYLRKVYQSVVEYLQIPISAEPDRYYAFDLHDFCKKFEMKAVPASNALKLLQQEGLWTLSDAVYNPATIQFTTDRQELDELANTYPDLAYVTTNLLRLYGTAFHFPTPVRIAVIAKQLKMKQELTEQLLLKLHEMELIEYVKPLDKPQLFFHHYRVDSRHLVIDMKRIQVLKQRHQQRTKAIISYLLNNSNCRSKIMLHYFGETLIKDCGHCDVCRAKQQTQPIDTLSIEKQILEHLSAMPQPVTLLQLTSQFPPTIRLYLTALVRQMIDEGSIKLARNGSLSIA